MRELKSAEQPAPFEEQLFVRTVEQIVMFPAKMVFVFEDGTKIPVEVMKIVTLLRAISIIRHGAPLRVGGAPRKSIFKKCLN